MVATRYLSVAQRFPFPASCYCLYQKDSLMDGWAHRIFFTFTAKYKLKRTTHISEFNSNRYMKLRAIEGSSAQPFLCDAAPHTNKFKPKTYLSKTFFLPAYFPCLNEHLLQRKITSLYIKNSTLHQNVIYRFVIFRFIITVVFTYVKRRK
jgi:hypothetical protein